MAKAKPKKKVKKKTKKATKPRKKAKKRRIQPIYGLHEKKLDIMAEVPIMPCSVIGKDRYGLRFAHTQAEKVFQRYSELCRQKHLVIRMIDCKMETLPFPFTVGEEKVAELLRNISFTNLWPWTRAVCTFEIRDTTTGETETFMGAGLGNNDVWSDNSAQTVAFKQGLLMYFFTAWPQPTDYLRLIRESLEEVGRESIVDALKQIMPDTAWNVMESTGAVKALTKFFGGNEKCQKQHKSKIKSK